ncbi:unnamed protein product [marine sediment metagenome]|uniref:ABC transmembrane type-1 domain-containing protein n=1 Tax=marine sediment metagenome TaxID=412755 RepID=X1C307_9ZZZZ
MIKSFFWNKKWLVWAWGGLIFLLISLYFQVYMSVLFNKWYGQFYDMMQMVDKYTVNDFWHSLIYFTKIALVYVVLATITNYFTRIYSLRWREAITFNYIPRWKSVKEEIEGASQRIQEDTYRFARIVESLGLQVVRAIMTLVAFLPILWTLSAKINNVILFGESAGSLVWIALLVSVGGYGYILVRWN